MVLCQDLSLDIVLLAAAAEKLFLYGTAQQVPDKLMENLGSQVGLHTTTYI